MKKFRAVDTVFEYSEKYAFTSFISVVRIFEAGFEQNPKYLYNVFSRLRVSWIKLFIR